MRYVHLLVLISVVGFFDLRKIHPLKWLKLFPTKISGSLTSTKTGNLLNPIIFNITHGIKNTLNTKDVAHIRTTPDLHRIISQSDLMTNNVNIQVIATDRVFQWIQCR